MNATAMCFFCGLSPSTHDANHTILGLRPACDDCDPDPRGLDQHPQVGLLDKMVGALVARVQLDGLDLGDERVIDRALRDARFSPQAIDAFQERATDQARRQVQRVESRFRPFERGAEMVAFAVMIGAWVAGFCLLNPPENHRHVYFAQVQR